MAASGFSAPRSMAPHGSGMWRAATGLPYSTPRHRPSDAVVFFAGNGSMRNLAIDRTIRGGLERATKARCLARHRKGCNSHAPAGGFAGEVCFQETAKLNSMADLRRIADPCASDVPWKLVAPVLSIRSFALVCDRNSATECFMNQSDRNFSRFSRRRRNRPPHARA